MSYYGNNNRHPEIELGREYVSLPGKTYTRTARILRDETDAGLRRITLDRLIDRSGGTYVERTSEGERKWTATGAFTTELTTEVAAAESEVACEPGT